MAKTKTNPILIVPVKFTGSASLTEEFHNKIDDAIQRREMSISIELHPKKGGSTVGFLIYPDQIDGDCDYNRDGNKLQVRIEGTYKLEIDDFMEKSLRLPARIAVSNVCDEDANSYYFNEDETVVFLDYTLDAE